MSPRRVPAPPTGWSFGTILRRRFGVPVDRVMFVRMCMPRENVVAGVPYFYGLTVKTGAYGARIGRLHRLGLFQVHMYKPDA